MIRRIWKTALNDNSDVKENLDIGRIVEVVNQVTDVLAEIS